MAGDNRMEKPARVRLCVVVPCYNEAKRLDQRAFQEFLPGRANVDVLFVNDGSTDDTQFLLTSLHTKLPDRVSVLSMPRNVGKAEAVRAGLLHALQAEQYELIGYWDADLATPLDTIASFMQTLAHRPDIEMIFGSRVKLCGRHIERQPIRHYLGRVFATTVSVMLRLAIYDTQCGAKLFRVRPETSSIFAEPFVSKWIFDVEILARFLQSRTPRTLEKQIFEYPLERWTDVAGSKVKSTDFIQALFETLTIRRKYLKKV